MRKKVDVVVINWNSGILTKNAVDPYLTNPSSRILCNVTVVDNASADGSLALLKTLPVKLIINTVNAGFGKACNQAIEHSAADYILLLNPDTKSTIAVLETLVDFLEKNPAYAIAGPQQLDDNGHVVKSCGRFPTFKTSVYELLGISKIFPYHFTPAPIMVDFDHLSSRDVDQVMGSYMLIKKSAIDITGFMDDDYFMYAEDRDLSKRMADNGFKSYYIADCRIVHSGGDSGDRIVALRLFYSMSARSIYWKKHLKSLEYAVLVLMSLAAEPVLRILSSPKKTVAIIKAYWLYLKKLITSK